MIRFDFPFEDDKQVYTMTEDKWYKLVRNGTIRCFVYCVRGYFMVFMEGNKGPRLFPLSEQASWLANVRDAEDDKLLECEPILKFFITR